VCRFHPPSPNIAGNAFEPRFYVFKTKKTKTKKEEEEEKGHQIASNVTAQLLSKIASR